MEDDQMDEIQPEAFVKFNGQDGRMSIEAQPDDLGICIRIGGRVYAADDDGAMQFMRGPIHSLMLTPNDAYLLGQFLLEVSVHHPSVKLGGASL